MEGPCLEGRRLWGAGDGEKRVGSGPLLEVDVADLIDR